MSSRRISVRGRMAASFGALACAIGGTLGCGGAGAGAGADAAGGADAYAMLNSGDAALSDAGAGSRDSGAPTPTTQGDGDVPTDASSDALVTDAGPDVAVARRPFPVLPNTGGRTLVSPTLVTIVASNDALASTLPGFSDAVVSSQVWAQVSAEYGLGAITSATHIVGPSLSGTLTTGQIADYISAAISGDAGPQPDGRTIYLVSLPDGATYEGTTFCGYHAPYPNAATSLGDQIATVMRCPPVKGGETQLGELTRIGIHEIVESATDPLDQGYNLGKTPATAPWTASIWQSYASSGHVELGDLCEGTREFELQDGAPDGGWEYQRMWSNAAAADGGGSPCIPVPETPFFSTTVPADWYAIPAGTTASVRVAGWADGTTGDWFLKLDLDYAGGTGALGGVADGGGVITSTIGPEPPPGCLPRAAMNIGTQGTIEISVPAGTPSGQFAVFYVAALPRDPGVRAAARGGRDSPLARRRLHAVEAPRPHEGRVCDECRAVRLVRRFLWSRAQTPGGPTRASAVASRRAPSPVPSRRR